MKELIYLLSFPYVKHKLKYMIASNKIYYP